MLKRIQLSENRIRVTASDETGQEMSGGFFEVRDTRFAGKYVKMLVTGGLETEPRFRRMGLVREIMAEGEKFGREQGALIAILHPFSFSFYRKFGYERVSDTIRVRFPMSAIDFVPYFRDVLPLTEDLLSEYLAYFEEFSKNRNLMPRLAKEAVDMNGCCVLKEGGRITGHIALESRKHFDGVNRMDGEELYVKQIGFLSPEALTKLLGFVRMFEGEQKEVLLRDMGPVPEIDLFLRHYMHTSYEIRPDIMAKVLDVKKTLETCAFETNFEPFAIKTHDGTYRVAEGTVEKLEDGADFDIGVSAQALSKLVFGCDKYTTDMLAYMSGVTLTETSEKAANAFKKQINGWFEHF